MLYKRSDKSKRFVDFYYRTGIICFRKAKDDTQPSKQIVAQNILDVRMLNDQPEDIGRAFSLTTDKGIMQLVGPTIKDTECWTRILKLVIEMKQQGLSVETKNPLVFEREHIQNIFAPKQNRNTSNVLSNSFFSPQKPSQNITFQTINI